MSQCQRFRILTASLIFLALSDRPLPAAAPPSTVPDIVTGLTRLESQFHDMQLRVRIEVTRTDLYFELVKCNQQLAGTRNPLPPRAETNIYEVREQAPRRSWTELSEDGSLVQISAFDGLLLRQYRPAVDAVKSRGTIIRQATTAGVRLIRPDTYFAVFGNPLAKCLRDPQAQVAVTGRRELNGEQLIDLEINTVYQPAGGEVGGRYRTRATINVSRQFWPVFLRAELTAVQNSSQSVATEVTSTGWIQSGGFVFPKLIQEKTFNAVPTMPEPPPDHTLELKLTTTRQIDIQQIAVNVGIPAGEFSPQFPVGTIYYDGRDRKHYQVDPLDQTAVYTPKPRGIQGAVFAYHLCWITALGAYGIIRYRGRRAR